MLHFRCLSLLLISLLFVLSCSDDSTKAISKDAENSAENVFEPIRFESIPSTVSGISFNNKIDVVKVKTFLEYINAYNGGGVGIGDFNNDGLDDIYFTGNTSSNKLYINKGDFKFEEITKTAGVAAKGKWCTGVTVEDINKDGFQDIYVCVSYLDDPSKRENLLYINNGDLTFTESAEKYGLNDSGYSIEAAFLDYDKDNDLDLYIANSSTARLGLTFDEFHELWKNPPADLTDRLFRNDGGIFTDVTKEAGVFNYGFSLSISVADYNNDGWPDIYTAVDHAEPDILYQNNKDGTFTNVINEKFPHFTFSSMGSDAADINNDGYLDLYVVDMLSDNNYRNKAQMGDMNPDFFWGNVNKGYHYSYMRNQLHLNSKAGVFSDIGQMAGVDKTDWSWSPLLADLNNNGFKDLFITNGYLLDIMDKDSRSTLDNKFRNARKKNLKPKKVFLDHALQLTSTKLNNYCYHNNGDLTFKDVSSESGLDYFGFSNGGAYADLDNDGDLDLVVNNINDEASIYKNKAELNGNHFIKIILETDQQIEALGTKVYVTTGGMVQMQEFNKVRGYQSSVHSKLHFGLGDYNKVDKIRIVWGDGKEEILTSQMGDQTLSVNYRNASLVKRVETHSMVFQEVSKKVNLDFTHIENEYDDYEKQVLLPHKMSQFGPHISHGDVNGDGLEDLFVGGAAGQAGQIFTKNSDNTFTALPSSVIKSDKKYEDYGSLFFDVDGDKDMDLYVVSGGNAFDIKSDLYQDRLYINNGNGIFSKGSLPSIKTTGSVVIGSDYDQDGDIDLFIGGRHVPGEYPKPADSYLLKNDNGVLALQDKGTDIFKELGMVTDALWHDVDDDGLLDLIVVGEWMPITILKQSENGFENHTQSMGLGDSAGWWNTIKSGDFNGDGQLEFIVGNLGLNYKYHATKEKPFMIYGNDFDENGKYDIVLSFINDEGTFPLRGRQCSSEQIPSIASEFENYDQFAKASLQEVYGEKLNQSLHYRITDFRTVMMQKKNGVYVLKPLSNESQMSPVFGIGCQDFDKDGNLDIVLGGNLFIAEVETGRADAGKGYFFKGDGKGNFEPIQASECGFTVYGDVRDISVNKDLIFVANNNAAVQVFSY